MKPYKDGTSLEDILKDGWSRGFLISQTLEEAVAMGYNPTELEVMGAWRQYDIDMADYYYRNDPYHENDDGWIEV